VELCYAITRHAFEVNDSDGKYYGSMVYMNFKRIPVDYVRHLIASRKPQDKEAEAVNEALRENGAQQTRPMGAEVARRRWGSEARAQPVPTGRSFKSGGRGW